MNATSPLSFASKELTDLRIPHQVSVDPLSGAANVRVDLPLTPGRAEFHPALSLAYSSQARNSAFGMGWSLSGVPTIGLSFKDGLPKYDGTDKYAFGGAELVPWLQGGTDRPRVVNGGEYWIHLYRNKIESGYQRFEKWVHKTTQQVHWRLRDKNNTVSIFGFDGRGVSRIFDPEDEHRTFQWLLEGQYDRHGNAIRYEYAPENTENVAAGTSFERGRVVHSQSFAQRHLKRILYGNARPLGPEDPGSPDSTWLFEVVLDYGEHGGGDLPSYEPGTTWPARLDPFSFYRAGFEIRTYRLCRRISMFHRFSELGEGPTLVGMWRLEHRQDVAGSTLERVHYTGYRRDPLTDRYSSKSLPPLVFHHSDPQVEQSFLSAPEQTQDNAPYGVGGLNYRWIDLYGEGLPGILFESDQAWYFKPNLGGGRLGPQHKVLEKPSVRLGEYSISDFDGDGNLNLTVLQGRQAGYYEYDRDAGRWNGFQAFAAAPHVNVLDAGTQLLDLNGDGRADIVAVKEDRLTWYPSRGKEGFDPPIELAKPLSNGVSQAPTLGNNPSLDYFHADMTGDGSPDQVKIVNGRVEYWPQLGNGRFGVGVVMEDAPVLDFEGALDASRIRLVDLDGSGTADLLYLGRGEIRYWINASGNRFVAGGTIRGLPYIDNLASVQVLDFLGNGTPCLVWSTTVLNHAQAPLQYLRLTDGVKPRLLLRLENSMGQEVSVTYGHSASHYLRDKRDGQDWTSKLPNHVTVVDRLEVIDRIGNTRSRSLYAYHDGFFDSRERQFRGFGLVDQYDSDTYLGSATASETDHSEPVCVRTWFHNGAPDWQSRRSQAYYQGDTKAISLPWQVVETPSDLVDSEFSHAFRALAGQVVRSEMYGLDRDGRCREHPYQVTQASYRVRRLQSQQNDQDPCFAVFNDQSLTAVYEQDPTDPRVTHSLTLTVDDFGNVTEGCRVAYPRRSAHPTDVAAQRQVHIDVARARFLNVDEDDRYLLGIPLESKSFEIAGVDPPRDGVFELQAIRHELAPTLATPLAFDRPFDGGPQARLMQWSRTYYWNDARSEPLAWGDVGRMALVHHGESASFNTAFIDDVYGGRVNPTMLRGQGRYIFHDEYWWQTSATLHYLGADAFYLLSREERLDEEGRPYDAAIYAYDPYAFSLVGFTDALHNRVQVVQEDRATAAIDYHLLAPHRIVDPNNNASEVRYDPLGMVVVASNHGEVLTTAEAVEPYGDEPLSAYRLLDDADFERVLAEPLRFLQQAGAYSYYDLASWTDAGLPIRSISLAREELVHDGTGGGASDGRVQIAVSHLDGFGRELQSKARVEAGLAVYRDESGHIVVTPGGTPALRHADVRWRVSGHAVFNNKQQVVRQYEPFFSPTPAFESDEELDGFGVTTESLYDPPGRLERTIFPNGTLSRTEFGAWETRQYDPNDAVDGSPYAAFRETRDDADPEKQALRKAQAHQDTPIITHLDPSGREVVVLESNKAGLDRRTETELDHFGAPRRVIDPRGLTAFTYRGDMLGRALYENSVDAGEKWNFPNALDQPLHLWDAAGAHQRQGVDLLGRVTSVRVTGDGNPDRITERMIYGDDPSVGDAVPRNARGRLVQHFDPAGLLTIHSYDPNGNPLRYDRRLLADHTAEADWTVPGDVALEGDPPFATENRYDALGRLRQQRLPDDTTRQFSYLHGGGVREVRVSTTDGALTGTPILREATYNARGQRTRAVLGNDVAIAYTYDPQTYRLSQLEARRPDPTGTAPDRVYQDIHYTYDPVGNITNLVDRAQQPDGGLIVGLTVSAHSEFTYDAFYQLTRASGRVHEALQRHDYDTSREGREPNWIKGTRHLGLNNGAAVRRYTRTYEYDPSGNMRRLIHQTHMPGGDTSRNWRRDFWISSRSNRALPATDLSDAPIADPESRFDAKGNCLYLPHLRGFSWNYRNSLTRAVIIDRTAEGRPNDAEYYVYGGDGLRVRKVTDQLQADGSFQVTEKIYLDGCEIKRVRHGARLILERKTSHLSDGDQRIALLHQWTADESGRETDNVTLKKYHYQLTNHLGSVSLELGERGNLISYEEYFPYGGTAFVAGDSLQEIRLKDYRYSGKERDDATGLYYFGYRYYSPWLGRWLSPDPIGPQDGLNLYQYVQNNPVDRVDPDGLQSTDIREIPRSQAEDIYGQALRNLPEADRERLIENPDLALTAGGEVISITQAEHLHVIGPSGGSSSLPDDYLIDRQFGGLAPTLTGGTGEGGGARTISVGALTTTPTMRSEWSSNGDVDDYDPFSDFDDVRDDPLGGLDLGEIDDVVLPGSSVPDARSGPSSGGESKSRTRLRRETQSQSGSSTPVPDTSASDVSPQTSEEEASIDTVVDIYEPYDSDFANNFAGMGQGILDLAGITTELQELYFATYLQSGGGIEGIVNARQAFESAYAVSLINSFIISPYEEGASDLRSAGTFGEVFGGLFNVHALGVPHRMAQAYADEAGGSTDALSVSAGISAAVDAVNPYGQIRRSLAQTWASVESGDAFSAGRNFMHALTLGASQALPFAGAGAGASGSVVGRGAASQSPVLPPSPPSPPRPPRRGGGAAGSRGNPPLGPGSGTEMLRPDHLHSARQWLRTQRGELPDVVAEMFDIHRWDPAKIIETYGSRRRIPPERWNPDDILGQYDTGRRIRPGITEYDPLALVLQETTFERFVRTADVKTGGRAAHYSRLIEELYLTLPLQQATIALATEVGVDLVATYKRLRGIK